MPATDWAPGTQIKPTIVHVTFDENGVPNHVGIGYEIFLPSGSKIAADAFTWTPPTAVAARLSAVMTALMTDLASHAGMAVNHALGRPVSPPSAPVIQPTSSTTGSTGAAGSSGAATVT